MCELIQGAVQRDNAGMRRRRRGSARPPGELKLSPALAASRMDDIKPSVCCAQQVIAVADADLDHCELYRAAS